MIQTRVLTAIVLVTIFGFTLFKASHLNWIVFILLLTFWASWEWSKLAHVSNILSRVLYSIVITLSSYLFYIYSSDTLVFWLTPMIAAIMVFMVGLFQMKKGKVSIDRSVTLLLGWLTILPFSVSMVVFRETFSSEFLLASMSIVWAIDTGAFFVGRRYGKHKLALYVSPGKTWEGVFGGVFIAFIVAYFGLLILTPNLFINSLEAALILSLIGAFSVYGDLFESLLKRHANLKDSGNLLPGHGGVLDRIDSLIIAVPLFYIFWLWAS